MVARNIQSFNGVDSVQSRFPGACGAGIVSIHKMVLQRGSVAQHGEHRQQVQPAMQGGQQLAQLGVLASKSGWAARRNTRSKAPWPTHQPAGRRDGDHQRIQRQMARCAMRCAAADMLASSAGGQWVTRHSKRIASKINLRRPPICGPQLQFFWRQRQVAHIKPSANKQSAGRPSASAAGGPGRCNEWRSWCVGPGVPGVSNCDVSSVPVLRGVKR